jgi:TPR repeat protein
MSYKICYIALVCIGLNLGGNMLHASKEDDLDGESQPLAPSPVTDFTYDEIERRLKPDSDATSQEKAEILSWLGTLIQQEEEISEVDPVILNSIGTLFEVRSNTYSEKELSIPWYRKAAEGKNLSAYTNLGHVLYDLPNSSAAQKAEALSYFKLAAESGNGDYQVRYYHYLKKNPENKREAIEWLVKAVDQEDINAMNVFGSMQLQGSNLVPQDIIGGIKLLMKCIEKGNENARSVLETIIGDAFQSGRITLTQNYSNFPKI